MQKGKQYDLALGKPNFDTKLNVLSRVTRCDFSLKANTPLTEKDRTREVTLNYLVHFWSMLCVKEKKKICQPE